MSILYGLVLLAPMQVDNYEALSTDDLNDVFSLLRRADVQSELHMSFRESRAWRDNARLREMEREFHLSHPTPSPAERREFTRKILLQRIRAVTRTFSPEQHKRLDELRIQHRGLNFGTPKMMKRYITLTDEQKAAIKKKEEELGQELRILMWSFHRQAQRELKESMTPEQRAAWEKQVGAPFEFRSIFQGLSPLGALQ